MYAGAAWRILATQDPGIGRARNVRAPYPEEPVKAPIIAGLLLIAFGIVGFILGGIPTGSEETTVGVGPVEVTAERRNTIEIPPLVSGLALVAGIGLIFVAARKPR